MPNNVFGVFMGRYIVIGITQFHRKPTMMPPRSAAVPAAQSPKYMFSDSPMNIGPWNSVTSPQGSFSDQLGKGDDPVAKRRVALADLIKNKPKPVKSPLKRDVRPPPPRTIKKPPRPETSPPPVTRPVKIEAAAHLSPKRLTVQQDEIDELREMVEALQTALASSKKARQVAVAESDFNNARFEQALTDAAEEHARAEAELREELTAAKAALSNMSSLYKSTSEENAALRSWLEKGDRQLGTEKVYGALSDSQSRLGTAQATLAAAKRKATVAMQEVDSLQRSVMSLQQLVRDVLGEASGVHSQGRRDVLASIDAMEGLMAALSRSVAGVAKCEDAVDRLEVRTGRRAGEGAEMVTIPGSPITQRPATDTPEPDTADPTEGDGDEGRPAPPAPAPAPRSPAIVVDASDLGAMSRKLELLTIERSMDKNKGRHKPTASLADALGTLDRIVALKKAHDTAMGDH